MKNKNIKIKKNGFVLLEVMFGLVFASSAILGFFSFVSHLINISSITLNTVEKIQNTPIFYSPLFMRKNFGKFIQDENEKKEEEKINEIENFSLEKINLKDYKDMKSLTGFIYSNNNKNEEKDGIKYLVDLHFVEKDKANKKVS